MVMLTDETHFYLDGFVNKQNCRYWAAENPRELHQRPLHSQKVTMWYGISQFGIIGHYYFENEREEAVIINSERYLGMLQEFLIPHLEENEVDMEKIWFQQDGATAHTARVSIAFLQQTIFPGCVISRYGDVFWPPRSPGISPSNFFL
jgi:hypothetical protein|uniref:Transposable element Tc3 transposase n=1 Tax=Sipha flava TaxID=143950 RepID=A0A2S2PZ44_9HEMI